MPLLVSHSRHLLLQSPPYRYKLRKVFMHKQRFIIAISALVGLLSVFLPWVSVSAFGMHLNSNAFGISSSQTAAYITIILFGIMALISFLGHRLEPLKLASIYALVVASGLALCHASYDILTWNGKVNEIKGRLAQASTTKVTGTVGIGLYIILLAALVVLIMGLIPLFRHYQSKGSYSTTIQGKVIEHKN